MTLSLEGWLSNAGRANDLLQVIHETIEFSRGEYAPFFQNCGLYAVGSSLTENQPNDIDLVLVGLDFRAVASYDKVFLQDPETLIEQEIVIDPELARERGVVSPFIFTVRPDGMDSLWHSLPERPRQRIGEDNDTKRICNGPQGVEIDEPDRLEDLSGLEQYMLEGIEHNGKYWAFNYQGSMITSQALSLETYCLRKGKLSKLVKEFYQHVASSIEKYDRFNIETPFEPYFHEDEYFLTTRYISHEIGCPSQVGSNKKPCDCRPIDLIIHAENLYVNSWKRHQEALNYPYLCLHEWPKASEETKRPILTDLPQPEFIDPSGEKRVKIHRYFAEYLRKAPINID